ncbi:glycosyltransferase family 2 protein [Methylosinus sporium]|uniref:glycosyltransferase family 2 protein n=1 Tax=Methylosinus sporium TaxID=428 RepID=UPI00383B9C3A
MLENFTQFQKIEDGDNKMRRLANPPASGRELASFLPLVSIIITNYNYGRFLREALDSVFAQTYPHIECIIVDDASTDDSDIVLESIRHHEPHVRIISHKDNAGQTTAFRTGLVASSGEYVVFLDADDMLLPTFVETHVFIHLSLRVAVGFTSSDMFQSVNGRIVRSSWTTLSDYVASGRGLRKERLRRIDVAAGDLWPFEHAPLDDVESRVHFVDPFSSEDWVYAPTSGNCFRRDALRLFLGDGPLMDLRFHGDTYLNKGVRLLNGAALIDAPLAIYRIHGGNGFASHAELWGVHSAAPFKAFRAEYFAWRAVVDRLIDHADELAERLGAGRYVGALVCLQKSYVDHPDFQQFESLARYIEKRLETRADSIRACLGSEAFDHLSTSVKHRRKRRVQAKRRAPRPWIRPFAEFFLTAGRSMSLTAMTKIGDQLWHF